MIPIRPDFDIPLAGITKGLPIGEGSIAASALGRLQLNILRQDVELPAVVLKISALEHNLRWMERFVAATGVAIAPHAKTTMSPQLIALQFAHGAWGISAATSTHIHSYVAHGVRKILHANQLVGKANIDGVLGLLARTPDLDFYTLVDSFSGLDLLRDGLQRMSIGRPLQLLIELGAVSGRAGVREPADALALARAIASDRLFTLSGVECFEGIYSGRKASDDIQAADFIRQLSELAISIEGEGLFGAETPIITAGGSAYFDIVASLAEASAIAGFQIVIRSGCYLTHDSVHYDLIHHRRHLDDFDPPGPGLRPALEVVGCVQSRPQNELAIINMGKRDISHDLDMPKLLWTSKGGVITRISGSKAAVSSLNDQHMMLLLPKDNDLKVGDLVGFGVSHPCTTFDKWKFMLLVDDDYNVVGACQTLF